MGETRGDLGKRSEECDALKAKVDKLEKELATLRDAVMVNDEKRRVLELRLVSDARAIAHLVMLLENHRSNVFFVNAENGQLR